MLVVADIGALQVRIERRHGLLGADVAEDVVGLQRLAATVRRAKKLYLRKVAVFDRAAFERRKSSGALTHVLEGLSHILVGNVHGWHFQLKTLVAAKLEFRQDLKYGAEPQRLAFAKIQLVHLRLRNRSKLLFRDRSFDAFRY